MKEAAAGAGSCRQFNHGITTKASCYWISNEVPFLFMLANVLIRRVASIIL